MTKTAFGIRRVWHYRDSQPGSVLAAFASRAEALAMENELSTCSFCSPGSAPGNYSTGQCYELVKTSRKPGYISNEASRREMEAFTGLAS